MVLIFAKMLDESGDLKVPRYRPTNQYNRFKNRMFVFVSDTLWDAP